MIRATHLLRRTLIPIIVPIENDRLLRRRLVTTVSVRLVELLIRKVAETVQSPKTSRPLHAHTSPRRSVRPTRIVVPGGGGVLEFPLVRHDECTHAIRRLFLLMIPGLDAADALPFRSMSVLIHGQDGVDEIPVGGFGFVPAFQAQVALLQPFDVHLDPGRFHRVDGPIVAVVAFDDESERVLVHAHRLAVVAHARVQLREQLGHLEGFGIEGAPDAAEVVADVFAESDGVGAVVFVGVRRLDVAATDGDDGVGRPGLLDFAGGPEEFEEPLLII